MEDDFYKADKPAASTPTSMDRAFDALRSPGEIGNPMVQPGQFSFTEALARLSATAVDRPGNPVHDWIRDMTKLNLDGGR